MLFRLILERAEPVGGGKQVACPETGPIPLSADVTPPPSSIHTHLSLLGSGPEATELRLEVIFPTEQTVTLTYQQTPADIGSKHNSGLQ